MRTRLGELSSSRLGALPAAATSIIPLAIAGWAGAAWPAQDSANDDETRATVVREIVDGKILRVWYYPAERDL